MSPGILFQQLTEDTRRPRDDEGRLARLGRNVQIAEQRADDAVDVKAQPLGLLLPAG